MKFILMIESDGYQVCYWDQINELIGPAIAANWDRNKLYNTLSSMGFNIESKELNKAINKIEDDEDSFVILKSNLKNDKKLDTFINDQFTIDEE